MIKNYLVGYHGCEKSLAHKVVLNRENLRLSKKDYDWLGNGIYFWENDARRAYQWAKDRGCKEPAILGALINTGNLLDLTLGEERDMLEWAYHFVQMDCKKSNEPLPKNTKSGLNRLDCKVIQTLHEGLEFWGEEPFDTVRGLFEEGEPIYRGSRFREKSHIQVAVKNSSCIMGYFLPRNIT